jgi:predicted amidohydrolase
MKDLSITIIQSNILWENKSANLDMFASKIKSINNAVDLIVLPEMFTTGFSMNPKPFAETMEGETIVWLKQQALENKCALITSFIFTDNTSFYNRLVYVNKKAEIKTYDKHHLFTMGDENNHYKAGNEKFIVELFGWKISPLICYDLRFPVWSRNTTSNEYDVLIYIANWPATRSHHWSSLLVARAIENQSVVIGLNRVGFDGNNVDHSGDSIVINAKGESLSETLPSVENIETVILKYSDLAAYRNSFPVLLDGDKFKLD